MRRFLIVLLLAVALVSCSSFRRHLTMPDKNPPTLRQRPAPITGPHYIADLKCLAAVAKAKVPHLEWYESPNGTIWCDPKTEVDGTLTLICHDVLLKKVNPACMKLVAK